MSPLTRRQLLLGTAATAAGAAVGRAVASPSRSRLVTPTTLPSDPSASGIDHVIVVVMGTRSFAHYLGWMANEAKFGAVEGRQAELTYLDSFNGPQSTYRLDVRQGCGLDDPDHSYSGGRVQLNGGACDGFAKTAPD